MTAAVRFESISKRFPGVQALHDVTLDVEAGTCHALCGENGAGKSTLGNILAGIHVPDEGRLFIRGQPVRFSTPRDARLAGVGMVHQELAFCGHLSVAENLCLGALPAKRGIVDRAAMQVRAAGMLAEIGAEVDVRREAGRLSTAQQQLVQIAAADSDGFHREDHIIGARLGTGNLAQFDAVRRGGEINDGSAFHRRVAFPTATSPKP